MTQTMPPRSSRNSSQILGNTEPRIFTPPLRELTPETSYGFKVIRFADKVLKHPLDEWQQWLVIHIGELLEDGKTPRFSQVLVIVGRQNGKTELLKVLALYWMFVEKWPQILGMNASQTYAKEAMLEAAELALGCEVLASQCLPIFTGSADVHFSTTSGSRYTAKAANRRAGRGKSLDRVIVDELREHRDWNAYQACIPAMSARPYAQAVFITNQGDDDSVVLESLRTAAIEYADTGSGDESLGLFEWSAPQNCDITDPNNWALANPNLGKRLLLRTLKSAALLATTGQKEEADFRTERLCIKVKSLDAAVDPSKWERCYVPGTLADYKSDVAMCLDVSINRTHATLMAAAVMLDGKARIEFVKEWSGSDTMGQVANDLPGIIAKHQPRSFGWFPSGPAAGLASKLRDRRGRARDWAPPSVNVAEIAGEVTDACMGFADEVANLSIVHNDDSLVTAQITGAEKLHQGDRWRFHRKKAGGHADAAYAAAGAVLLARTQPGAPDFSFTPIKPKERS